ncbi:MAG: hypothetical protein ACP5KV_06275 [Candidatus Methanomethylicaceae archaeon]
MDHEIEVPHEESLNIGGYGSTFRIEFGKPVKPEDIKQVIEAFIKLTEDSLIRNGAKGVGHIKLHVKGKHGYMRADTLGAKYGIHVSGSLSEPEKSVQLTVNTIALGIAKREVERVTKRSIEQTAKEYNFSLTEKPE